MPVCRETNGVWFVTADAVRLVYIAGYVIGSAFCVGFVCIRLHAFKIEGRGFTSVLCGCDGIQAEEYQAGSEEPFLYLDEKHDRHLPQKSLRICFGAVSMLALLVFEKTCYQDLS